MRCYKLVLILALKPERRVEPFSFLFERWQTIFEENEINTTFAILLFVLLKYILYICRAIMQ